MEREAVTSSNVESVGYDPDTQTLEVEFKGGKIYWYRGVPAEVHAELMAAPSAGRFLVQRIKGVYDSQQVEGWAVL